MARTAMLAVGALWTLAGAAPQLNAQPLCVIQGSGPESPLAGSNVTTAGVVTADFSGAGLAGFFIQDPGCDSDPDTSDAVWVSAPGRSGPLAFGHRVGVTGRVVESFGLTTLELHSLSEEGVFPGSLEVVTLMAPADPIEAAAYLEAQEGMLVTLSVGYVVGATNRFGEAYLMPESSGVSRLHRGDEDGRKLGIGSPDGWLGLDHGDRVVGAVGPLTYTFGEFKLLVTQTGLPDVQRGGASPLQAAASDTGSVAIASYNLENFFDAIDDPGRDDGDHTPSPEGYAAGVSARARSIADFLGAPELLGVQEAENIEVLQDLAAAPELAAAGYQAVLIEGVDPRGIDVGLLYRGDRVRQRFAEARQACTDLGPAEGPGYPCTLPEGGGANLLFARPPLVVGLELKETGAPLTVVVNHFISQRGDDPTSADIRLAMASHVAGLLAELEEREPQTPVVVLGDLNDFEDSAPLTRLTEGGRLVDLHGRAAGERAYTSLFQGVSQTLDYILVVPALLPRVAAFGPSHVNVDFAHAAPASPPGSSHRVSDHDPLLLRLWLP
jgi:predicted extracellular nuclease